MEDLDAILEAKGVNRDTLSCTTTEEHRNIIAKEIDGALEILAPFIGVPLKEVANIKDEHLRKPLIMRLAMMERWYELHGSNATYLKLVEGLREIGRRDLIEIVIDVVKNLNTSGTRDPATMTSNLPKNNDPPQISDPSSGLPKTRLSDLLKTKDRTSDLSNIRLSDPPTETSDPPKLETRDVPAETSDLPNANDAPLPNSQSCCNKKLLEFILIVLWIFITLLFVVITFVIPLLNELLSNTARLEMDNNTHSDRTNIKNHPHIHTTVVDTSFNHSKRKCEFNNLPGSDLPALSQEVFVGREVDVQEVFNKVTTAHIININGAPGFGKSALAVQVGYKVIRNGTSVRYLNLEDKLSLFKFFKSQEVTNPEVIVTNPAKSPGMNSVVEFHKYTIAMPTNDPRLSIKNQLYVEDLRSWSATIRCTTVLILDNCDDILASSSHHEFIDLINSLVPKSQFNLHIVVVSREKLLFLNSFACWTVKELSQSASIQLLDQLAPAISHDHLREVAELIQGCPLALKVVGQLLHIHGSQLIHNLKRKLITVLDKASVRKEKFRALMDVAFTRLGELKECGYSLSLFPGSFHKEAGITIITTSPEECLELYVKHSLLDEYFFANHYRYKMHRLIREYVKVKLNNDDEHCFNKRFRKYFSDFVLIFATKEELDYIEEHTFWTEVHNLDYLKMLLLNDKDLKIEELVALAFFVCENILQLEEVSINHYKNYLKYINNISQLITHRVCGQLYSQIVKIVYQQCKCETALDYVQKFIQSSCMKHFQCTVVDQIRYLQQSGILQLTHLENIFIQHVANYHCKIPIILSTIPFLLFPIKLFCNPRMTTLIVVVVVSMLVYNVGTGMYLQELGPIPLWFRCVSSGLALKWICHTFR